MENELANLDIYTKKGIDLILEEGPAMLGALLFLLVGLYVTKIVQKIVFTMMQKSHVDDSLRLFIKSFLASY